MIPERLWASLAVMTYDHPPTTVPQASNGACGGLPVAEAGPAQFVVAAAVPIPPTRATTRFAGTSRATAVTVALAAVPALVPGITTEPAWALELRGVEAPVVAALALDTWEGAALVGARRATGLLGCPAGVYCLAVDGWAGVRLFPGSCR